MTEDRKAYWTMVASNEALKSWRGNPILRVALIPPLAYLRPPSKIEDASELSFPVAIVRVENHDGRLVVVHVELPDELPPIPQERASMEKRDA